MANNSIRTYAKNKKVFWWEVAASMNISEPTMTRRLRTELSTDECAEIKAIIDKIAENKETA